MSDSEGLPKGWMRCRLSELAEIITGNTPPTSRPEFYGGDVPFVTPSDLVDRPIGKTRQTISETGIPQARTVPAEAILVSCIGNLGKTGITARPSAFNQQLNGVVFKPGVAPAYGFYACQCLKRYLEEVASATTIAIVNKSKFSDATIPVAPLGEQRRRRT
jgi:type I restriction enzyme S subunit